MSKGVDKTTAEYDAMVPNWNLTSTLMGGTTAMRDAKTTYLPQEDQESQKAYDARLVKSVLFPGYRRTLETFVGKPLEKQITVSEDTPEDIREWLDNVDLAGRDVDVFARDVFKASINDGLTHLYTEFPVVVDAADRTLEQERESGARPYAVHVHAKNVIGWKSDLINGEQRLTQVRISEDVVIDDASDEFSVQHSERIRVMEIGRVRVYEKKASSTEWSLVEEVSTSLSFIPFITIYSNRIGFMMGEPPLLDLAHLNVTHWQSNSDQRTILHIARVPFLHIASDNPEDVKSLVIGAARAMHTDKDTTIKYVEHTGSSIEAGVKDLEMIKEDMSTYGMEFLMRSAVLTATQRVIDKSEGDSSLAVMARSLKVGLERMVEYMDAWITVAERERGSLDVQTDFRVIGNTEELKTLWNMRMNGDLSQEQFWYEMQRRGVLADNFDPEVETDRLEAEVPALMDIAETIDTTEEEKIDE